jgi:hypothetical protein
MREIIESFDRQFRRLHDRSVSLIGMIDDDRLFRRPRDLRRSYTPFSCGEYIVKSAAAVEQTVGGITTRLWDDPFEWTLPEELSTAVLVSDYLNEVEEERLNGFGFFRSDEDLSKNLPSPRELRSIHQILLDTIARAEHFQGRAFAIFQMMSDTKLPPW